MYLFVFFCLFLFDTHKKSPAMQGLAKNKSGLFYLPDIESPVDTFRQGIQNKDGNDGEQGDTRRDTHGPKTKGRRQAIQQHDTGRQDQSNDGHRDKDKLQAFVKGNKHGDSLLLRGAYHGHTHRATPR